VKVNVMSDTEHDDRAARAARTLVEARELLGRLSFVHEPETSRRREVADEPETVRHRNLAGDVEPLRYGEDRITGEPDRAPAAAEDPRQGWNDWQRNAIANAIAEERKFQRDVHAEVIAHERRQFEAALKELREELLARIAMSAAEAGAEIAMCTAQLSVEVLAAKADLCRKMEATICEMRRVLDAGDARAADAGLSKVLN
jgi:hypothetical protein